MYTSGTTRQSAANGTTMTSRRRPNVQTTTTTTTTTASVAWRGSAATAAILAVLLAGAASAASTGAKSAAATPDLLAVGSEALSMAAAAAALAPPPAAITEPATAESKKLAGHSALMDGYALTGSHKGDRGYNEDDVFGDKIGDSYGFGTQTAYGTRGGDGGGAGAYHESSSYDDNGRSNPKYSSWHFEDKDGKPTKRYVFDSQKNKKDPQAVEAEASEYDSVEAYDYPDDGGTHAGYEAEEPEPEYGALYDSADVYDGDY